MRSSKNTASHLGMRYAFSLTDRIAPGVLIESTEIISNGELFQYLLKKDTHIKDLAKKQQQQIIFA